MTTQPGRPEYYEDAAGDVRWRVRAASGEITEASSEGFVDLRNAFDNYTLTRANVQVSYNEAQEQFHGHSAGIGSGEFQGIGLTGHDASPDGEGEEEDPDAAKEGAGGPGDVGGDSEDEDEGSPDPSTAD